MRCPCRKVSEAVTYEACCGPLHRGERPAPTAETLMRARYAAYVLGDLGYIARTWHPATRPPRLAPSPGERWLSLRIRASAETGDRATVHFEARSRAGGRNSVLEETSRFERIDGQWLYVDGDVSQAR